MCEFAKTNPETTLTQEELSALIREVGLGHVEDKLMQAARPSLRLHLHPADEASIPLGGTKFGGAPDLPPDFEWPIWQGYPESDRPRYPPGEFTRSDGALCFLAQFRLSELTEYDLGGALPSSGILYFFCAIWKMALGYDETDRDCWKVFYCEGDPSALVRQPPPLLSQEVYRDAILPDNNRFTCCHVEFQPEIVLPDWNDPEAYELLGLSKDESEKYWELFDSFESSEEPDPRKFSDSDGPIHSLLGYPQIVQYDRIIGANFVPGHDQEWRLLLQLDTEDITSARTPDFISVHWQGGGRGYFYIPVQSLAEQNFDAVWVDMQCT